VSEGVCVRLYSEASYKSRPAFTDPEIRRSGLASVILQMKSLALSDIEDFPFIDRPDAGAVRDGYVSLFELGATTAPDRTGKLTPVGRAMARIPADPRIARIMLAAEPEGSLDEAMVLAAALSVQDPRERPAGKQSEADAAHEVFRHETSDFMTLLNLWDQYRHAQSTLGNRDLFDWCRRHFVSAARMREWGETLHQIRQVAEDLELRRATQPATEDAVHRALLTGLIANVACREGDASSYEYRAMHASGVSIFPGSALFKKSPRWIMAGEIVHTTRLYARTVARIDPAWIEELAAHVYQRHLSDPHLDPATGEPCAWERITLAGVAVVPRRRTNLAEIDPARAREVFIRDALARALWKTEDASAPAFINANLRVRALADAAADRLRRHHLREGDAALAAWFEQRLPKTVHNPASLAAWWKTAADVQRSALHLSPKDVLAPDAAAALDPAKFPDQLALHADTAPSDAREPVATSFAFAAGQEHDGLTFDIPLTSLHHLNPDRAAWLVPGWTPDLFAALLKTTPKAERAKVEALGPINETAAACAEVSAHGIGTPESALAEALGVLFELRIDPGAFDRAALPPHLRPRFRVLDHHAKELAASRDLHDLRSRLEGRAKKARAAKARLLFQREGMTQWDFDEIPTEAPEDESPGVTLFPALIDRSDSVELTLVESPVRATALTHAGVRRLLLIACRDEADAYIDSLPDWPQMVAHHKALGPADALRDGVACLAIDRAFMTGAEPIRTRAAFESALQERRGRLPTAVREVADTVAKTLEPRAKVAHRLGAGTPRLWAASIADIREHAAYLMPAGFLLSLTWERLRRYPLYAAAMRERLFRLREDGSGAETELLNRFAPHWKRFTGWVAQRLSADRVAAEQAMAEQAEAARKVAASSKAPLPQARRAAPRVNLEAGEWAMQPGALPPEVEAYRWALEDARVTLFAPELAGGTKVTLEQLDSLWKKVEPTPRR
ncbi:MAG: DUF3418 domain-containing protein, partial [Planctomycetes bacterium]|nr:DUF3418 domain-containing protein [Planctomycetota bacterium]